MNDREYREPRARNAACGATRLARALTLAVALALACAAPAGASPFVEFGDGRGVVREDPDLPARGEADLPPLPGPAGDPAECPLPPPPPAKPSELRPAVGPSVNAAIETARKGGKITDADARRYRADYAAARSTRSGLSGRNRTELSSVISTLERISAAGRLTGSRMPALFLQLRRNSEFWGGSPTFPPRDDIPPEPCSRPATGPSGARVSFEGSQLIFQYYPGRGLQLQPLANFGKANGMYTRCRRTPAQCDAAGLRVLLDELVAIRSSRGGFTTWEYWFDFGGGAPPWTSGLSQGTAIQALSRGSILLDEPSYLSVAKSALGAFQKAPPTGVRVRGEAGGSHYLIYSFSPGLRVLNGFIQSLVGLHDYADISKDSRARALFRAGDRSARREVPRFDTGAWSLYSRGGAESNLGYHELVRDFLRNLCNRTDTPVYCRTGTRFTNYLKRPTKLTYRGPSRAKVGRATSIRFALDKISCVTMTIADAAGATVLRRQIKLARGTRTLAWTPRAPGRYTVRFEVLDLKKNKTELTRTVTVER